MHVSGLGDFLSVQDAFRWAIPAFYNIGVDVCDRWALLDPGRPAIIDATYDGAPSVTTFEDLRRESNQLARALRCLGVMREDRVAVLLPQAREAVAAHVATYKLGAVAVPLASVFGMDALSYRLADSGAKVVITSASGAAKLAALNPRPPTLQHVI